MVFKSCFITSCTSDSNIPDKLFITVPRNPDRRKKWFEAVNYPRKWYTQALYVCEDHFNLDKDAENWMYFKTFGKKILLKKDVVPHLYLDGRTKIPPSTGSSQMTDFDKKRKESLLRELYYGQSAKNRNLCRSEFEVASPTRKFIDHSYVGIVQHETSNSVTLIRLDPTEMAEMYGCLECSHQTELDFHLDHHIQRKHKNVYAAHLFHAIVQPDQLSCICCDYKSYYQFELYEHCKQAHNPRTENNENMSFRKRFARYPCYGCKFESDSSLLLVKHHGSGDQITSRMPHQHPSLDLNSAVVKSCTDVTVKSNVSRHGSSEKIDRCQCLRSHAQAKRRNDTKLYLFKHARCKEIKWLQCNHCSYRTKRQTSLKGHMFQHVTNKEIDSDAASDGIRWFQCNHCSHRAKAKTVLKRHIMLQHAADAEISIFKFCNVGKFLKEAK